MVFRGKPPTPTRLPANSLYTLMDNTLLHSISSVCHQCVPHAIVVRLHVHTAGVVILTPETAGTFGV